MKHLLAVSDLAALDPSAGATPSLRAGIESMLDLTASFVEVSRRDIPKVPALRGKTIVSLFYEDSTRTRLSFETAAKRLGADTMTFSVATSSVKKGESLLDTVQTIEAMGVHAIVVRHSAAGAAHRVASWSSASVINAGDGRHEHPTQALLDAFTLRRHRGPSLDGCRVAIVGDIANSRAARSNVLALRALGCDITLVGPPTLMPSRIDGWPVTVWYDLDDVLPDIDVVYLLRIQLERDRGGDVRFPTLREYSSRWGLTAERAARLKPDTLVMHPGPMNRGVEIAAEVADSNRSLVTEQVANGVAVRMAVLWSLVGSGEVLLSELLLSGGRVVDESGERVADVRVVDGLIAEVGAGLVPTAGALVLDAEGCVVAPGLVDIQVHFREPGGEVAETIETGARAAALGGCTAVARMPNTEPPLDDAAVVQSVLERGRNAACAVHVAGCITKGRQGEQLAPMGELYELGVRMFTDDGDCVADARVMRGAFEYLAALPGSVLSQHAEDPALVRGGHMHEGAVSARLGIPGRPAIVESSIVARDIALAKLTGGRYHVLHVSSGLTVDLVRAAKSEGLRVTAECTPQHLVLTDAACEGFDPVFKMNPPLREQTDVDALRAGLLDGTIDAIATDHAPHAPETKAAPFEEAPPGMLGVETALAVVLTTLVEPGVVSLGTALGALSWRPARLSGLDALGHGGPVAVGSPANLCVIDPAAGWVVDAAHLASRATNSPWHEWKLTGKVRHTILAGTPTVRDGAPTQ